MASANPVASTDLRHQKTTCTGWHLSMSRLAFLCYTDLKSPVLMLRIAIPLSKKLFPSRSWLQEIQWRAMDLRHQKTTCTGWLLSISTPNFLWYTDLKSTVWMLVITIPLSKKLFPSRSWLREIQWRARTFATKRPRVRDGFCQAPSCSFCGTLT